MKYRHIHVRNINDNIYTRTLKNTNIAMKIKPVYVKNVKNNMQGPRALMAIANSNNKFTMDDCKNNKKIHSKEKTSWMK